MYEYRIKEVTRVLDGDTIDVVIDLGFSVLLKQRIRLAGIDTPESRTSDAYEKVFGLEAKDFLKSNIESAENITIKTEIDSTGKFGRVLGWIFLDDYSKSINQEMIDRGYAWEYWGKAKEKSFDELIQKREALTKE